MIKVEPKIGQETTPNDPKMDDLDFLTPACLMRKSLRSKIKSVTHITGKGQHLLNLGLAI